ncbi:hypothetical protein HGRIS_003852 [Hohenbuehelia grisea]|uniref:Uncharacterized protein n=1 Tax=Hohenbuehelia grisea TaxID=104357 RepID=A0ABR3JGR6_9AGAR
MDSVAPAALDAPALSSQSAPKVNRIKRKPPPAFDFAERYPQPDPSDPFAPLSTLRSRSSAAQFPMISQEDLSLRPSYTIYPSLPVGLTPTPSESADASWNAGEHGLLLPKSKKVESKSPQRESHYRTRSQSIAALRVSRPPPMAGSSPYGWTHSTSHADSEYSLVKRPVSPARTPPIKLPSLVHDDSGTDSSSSSSGTESEAEPFQYKHPRSAGSRSRLADFFLPRKESETLPSVRGRQLEANKRVTKMSISSPIPIESEASARLAKPAFPVRSTTGDSGVASASSSVTGHSETSSCSSSSPPTLVRKRVSQSPLTHAVSIPIDSSDSEVSPCDSSPCTRLPPSLSAPASTGDKSFARLMPHPHGSDASILPTAAQITVAAAHNIVAESGVRIPFGALFAAQRTAFIFVRHFWCPRCQDYLLELSTRFRGVVESALKQGSTSGVANPAANIRLIVIGHGAPAMVSKYRQMLGIPFDVYTDPDRSVFKALGLLEHSEPDTIAPRPPSARLSARPRSRGQGALERPGTAIERPFAVAEKWSDVERPRSAGAGDARKARRSGYVRHSLVGGIATVVYRALKVGMPILENGGDAAQLGGEFVFGPGNVCTYAHRMQNTRDHAPVTEVLMAAMNPGPRSKLLPLATAASEPMRAQNAAQNRPRAGHGRNPSISQPSISHPRTHARDPSVSFSQHPSVPESRFPTYAEYAARSRSGLNLNADLPPVPVDLDLCADVDTTYAHRELPVPVEEAEEERSCVRAQDVPEESEAGLNAEAEEASEEREANADAAIETGTPAHPVHVELSQKSEVTCVVVEACVGRPSFDSEVAVAPRGIAV